MSSRSNCYDFDDTSNEPAIRNRITKKARVIKGLVVKFHRSFLNIGISRIVQVSEQAKTVAPSFEKRTGEPFIYFQRGEVGYPTAPFIADGFKEAIEKGYTKYPKLGGEDYFKEAVLEDVYTNTALSFEKDNVVAVHGGQQGLELVFSLFRGKTCTILTPCWSCMFDNILPYTESAFISVPLDPDNNWSIRWEELEKALSVSEVFYFNSPHNPTGKVFSVEEIRKIAYLCGKYGVTLVSDEAYKGLVYKSHHGEYSPLQTGYENIVSVNTFSKTFAATGFRIGYVLSPRKDIINLLTGGNYTETAGLSTPTQYAFAKALTHPDRMAWQSSYWNEMSSRRTALVQSLPSSLRAIAPEGAFYCFFKASSPNGEQKMVDTLMDNGIAVVPGSAFGRDFAGYIRLSFSTLNKHLIAIGAERLGSVLISQGIENAHCHQPLC